MGLPFRDEIDEIFRGERSPWLKLGGCVAVAMFVTLIALVRMRRGETAGGEPIPGGWAAWVLVAAGVGATFGLVLMLKDVVERRLSEGERVHPVLKLYLGSRGKSIALWVVSATVLAFIAALAIP